MRKAIAFLFFLILTVAPLSKAAGVDDRFDPWTAPYNSRAEIRLEGTIEGVGIEPTPFGHWVYFTVVREREWFKVYLGPRDFVMGRRLLPFLDSHVTITGVVYDARRRVVIARIVRVAGEVIILRDADGVPRWESGKPGAPSEDTIDVCD